uniref:Uncharacterized protein n=1 Tax=Romanomermis culicivorax TaxID=13658 RepID=A0A915ITX6_ROMCU
MTQLETNRATTESKNYIQCFPVTGIFIHEQKSFKKSLCKEIFFKRKKRFGFADVGDKQVTFGIDSAFDKFFDKDKEDEKHSLLTFRRFLKL